MWQETFFDLCEKTEIKYKINDDFFEVKCFSTSDKINSASRLYAVFFHNDDNINFELGIFNYENGRHFVEKKYSISYLQNNGIDTNNFSHFVINISDNQTMVSHSCKTDKIDDSLIRAQKTLNSLKKSYEPDIAKKIIENISARTSIYNEIKLPILYDFKWFAVDNKYEFFGLSGIEHLMQSEGCTQGNFNNNLWFFGAASDERIYAVAVKCNESALNPLTNASDCVVKYTVPDSDYVYYVVGILVLDDGQYFCRLS